MKSSMQWGMHEIVGLSLYNSIHGPLLRSIIERYRNLEDYCKYGKSQSMFQEQGRTIASTIATIGRNHIEQHAEKGIAIYTVQSDEYPEALKQIDYPPTVLYVKGKLNLAVGYAIVGTRNPSQYGQRVTEYYASSFSQMGLCIISGLAHGIDTIAHSTTVKSGGLTYAVIASGHEMISPKNAKMLADEIIENGGAIISEYSMHVKAKPPFFPRRNRIISGLSSAVLIIESGKKGGSMITAQFAFDQNRELYVIPGSIYSPMSEGNHLLLMQQKAMITQDPEDMVQPFKKQVKDSASIIECDSNEHAILQLLSDEPMHIDSIISLTKLSTGVICSTLLLLECRQLIRQLSGKHFIRLTHEFTLKS
jgi:DNA processing protein